MSDVSPEENLDRAKDWIDLKLFQSESGTVFLSELALIDAVQAKGRAMVKWVRAPFPEDVFTPLTPSDVQLVLAAIRAAIGHAGSDRLYAHWARNLADVLAEHADEVPEAPDGRKA